MLQAAGVSPAAASAVSLLVRGGAGGPGRDSASVTFQEGKLPPPPPASFHQRVLSRHRGHGPLFAGGWTMERLAGHQCPRQLVTSSESLPRGPAAVEPGHLKYV